MINRRKPQVRVVGRFLTLAVGVLSLGTPTIRAAEPLGSEAEIQTYPTADPACPSSSEISRLLSTASQSMQEEQFDAVVALLRPAPLAACDARIGLLLGAALEGSGKSAEEQLILEQAHERWPSNHSVAASLARRYWLVGQPQKAANALASVSVTSATPLQELELRAEVYLAVHQLGPAQAAAEAAYRKSPSTDTLLLLANIIQTQGRAQDALTLLESRRKENAASAPFLITIAEAEFDSELYAAAHQDLVEALALDPRSYQAHYLFANTLVQQTKAKEAVLEYEMAIQIAPDKPRTYHQLALAKVILGDVNGARESLQQCVAADPKYAPAYTEIGKLLLQQGRYAEAVEPLQKAIEYGPTQEFPYYFLTRVYARLGQKQQSDEMLERYKAVETASRKHPTQVGSDDSSMTGQNTFSGPSHTSEQKP